MKDVDRTPPWYAPWRRVERARAEDDPADHGTAFGLELSLTPADELPGEPELPARTSVHAPGPARGH